MLALVRYSVIFVTILWFYLFYSTQFLNVHQMLIYYPTLILNETLLLLKHKRRWQNFLSFLAKITSLACLLRSELKLIFHWKAHCFILARSLLSSEVIITESWITRKREVLSAKSLVFDDKISAKSLAYIKNNNGSRMEFKELLS